MQLQSDKATLKQHLESVYKQTGVLPEQLKPVPMPLLLLYVWEWFIDLSRCRSHNGFGPDPINYTDIYSWSKLMGVSLTPFELYLIRALDDVYLTEEASHGS